MERCLASSAASLAAFAPFFFLLLLPLSSGWLGWGGTPGCEAEARGQLEVNAPHWQHRRRFATRRSTAPARRSPRR